MMNAEAEQRESEREAMDYMDCWVCVDCYVAHHYGYVTVDRAATDSEQVRYLDGYSYADMPHADQFSETAEGLQVTEWFSGESDISADREPLNRIATYETTDNTNSETGEGIREFSHGGCNGCGSRLGGSRYRLAIHD